MVGGRVDTDCEMQRKTKKNKRKKNKQDIIVEEKTEDTIELPSLVKKNKKSMKSSQESDVDECVDSRGVPANEKKMKEKFTVCDDNAKQYIENVKIVNGHKFTDDGFKVVSLVPDDDSDISDAFESDIDMEAWSSPKAQRKVDARHQPSTNQKGSKMTDDGFKIITEIPPDDSDVSDAFTDEEDEGFITGEELLAKKKHLSLKKQLKKPLLKMIDDFGKFPKGCVRHLSFDGSTVNS